MSFENFVRYLRAYSSQVKRWPEQAVQFFHAHAESNDGRVLVADEERLDQMLDAYKVDASLSPAFMSRIYEIATVVPAASVEWGRRYVSYSAVSFVACIILGLVVGVQLSGTPYFDNVGSHDLASLLGGSANMGGEIL